MNYRELVAAARAQIPEITAGDLASVLEASLVIDVREPSETAQGSIPAAILLPRGLLEGSIGTHVPDLDTPVVLYCSGGARSALAALSLRAMGYSAVSSLAGGFNAWKAADGPWDIPLALTNDQRARYARHTRLPEVGEAGQQRLLESRVLLVGAGGLGSPAAMYLAAAGVGTIGIVDPDVVDAGNLQRQILHRLDRVGEAKVESARRTMQSLNPDVKIEPFRQRLQAANAIDIMSDYDVVVDGADNFPTRYLINDAALRLRIPVVHGSIYRFEGQVTVFRPFDGPCYRCLYEEPPAPPFAASCEDAGVLGVLPGVVGSLQATEAIKQMLDLGSSLSGRLLIYDALDAEFTELAVQRRPDCPACGDEATPPLLVDYDEACRPAT